MKTKLKYAISIILILTTFLTVLVSCKSSQTTDIGSKEWLLVHEKEESVNGDYNYECYYEYDESGRLIGEHGSVGLINFSCTDYKYDSGGNVISKTKQEEYQSGGISSAEKTYYTYAYDSKGNCVSENAVSSVLFNTTFEYDEQGNVIRTNYTIIQSEEKRDTRIFDYDLTYMGGLCTLSEITITDINAEKDMTTSYSLMRFSYDHNNNKERSEYYTEIKNPTSTENLLEINGRYYSLSSIRVFEWRELSDIAVSTTVSENEENYNKQPQLENTTKSTSTTEIGFFNISEWGSKLIEIQTNDNGNFIFEDDIGMYVVIQEGTHIWEFYPSQKQVVMSSYYVNGVYSTEGTGVYTILDNDTFTVNGYSIRILDRFTHSGINTVQMTSGGSLSYLYIPYLALKTESIEKYEENGNFDYYKCYLR